MITKWAVTTFKCVIGGAVFGAIGGAVVGVVMGATERKVP